MSSFKWCSWYGLHLVSHPIAIVKSEPCAANIFCVCIFLVIQVISKSMLFKPFVSNTVYYASFKIGAAICEFQNWGSDLWLAVAPPYHDKLFPLHDSLVDSNLIQFSLESNLLLVINQSNRSSRWTQVEHLALWRFWRKDATNWKRIKCVEYWRGAW